MLAAQKTAKEAIVHDMEMALRAALAAVAPDAVLEYKWMFGGAGFYAYGRMFVAWFGAGLALKLPDDGIRDLLAVDGAKRTESPHYIETPPAFLDNPALLEPWVVRSLAYVRSLPEKKRKRR
jgi:TfoX/Sxy family transcriptional regulator of competence genes